MVNEVLIDLLREQIQEAEQELRALRGNLRYRIGEIALQSLPLSWRSLSVLPQLWQLYLERGSNDKGVSKAASPLSRLPESALVATELGLGIGLRDGDGFWVTRDAELMAQRLRTDAPVTSVILRHLSVPIARQLGRVKHAGARIIWWPDPETQHSPELESYIVALADECRLGELY